MFPELENPYTVGHVCFIDRYLGFQHSAIDQALSIRYTMSDSIIGPFSDGSADGSGGLQQTSLGLNSTEHGGEIRNERAEGAGELKEKEKGMAPVIGADCGDGKGRGGVLG